MLKTYTVSLLTFLLVGLWASVGFALIKEGSTAPAFALLGSDYSTYTLGSTAGKTRILYFYPKNETPGCTKEACSFRDRNKELQAMGVMVMGISQDPIDSHVKFMKKHKLNFPLLSDQEGKVCAQYGSCKGPGSMTQRQTFIIDGKGKIIKIYRSVNVETHVDEIIKFLKAKQKA